METMLWRQKSESPSWKKELGGRQTVKGKNKGSPTLFSWYKIQVLRVLLKKKKSCVTIKSQWNFPFPYFLELKMTLSWHKDTCWSQVDVWCAFKKSKDLKAFLNLTSTKSNPPWKIYLKEHKAWFLRQM